MDYDKVIKSLLDGHDVFSETGRKKAYQKCIEYADAHLEKSPQYNKFVAKAAKYLKQVPVVKAVIKQLVQANGTERLHLIYTDANGPVLTGNRTALRYLASILHHLSRAELDGDHIHFYYHEAPLFGESYPLTVYVEADEWFDKNAVAEEDGEEEEEFEKRDVNPERITAFLVVHETPPGLLITKNTIYKVLSCEKYDGQKAWKKSIREDSGRMYVLRFNDDDNKPTALAVDLDDGDLIFFSDKNLKQVLP